MIEFAWKDVKSYEVDEEGMSFNFEYDRPGKKPRLVKIFTPYVSGICTQCFLPLSELLWVFFTGS